MAWLKRTRRTAFLPLVGLSLVVASSVTWEAALAEEVRETVEVEVVLWVTPDGDVASDQHDTAVVFPGDRIRWVVRSTDGSAPPAIKIGGFQLIANLELFAHGGAGGAVRDSAGGVDVSAARIENGMEITADPNGNVVVNTPNLRESFENPSFRDAVFSGPESLSLFKRPWGGGLLDVEGALLSPEVADRAGHWLWSYEWMIERAPGTFESVDPHIFMHERSH